MKDSKYLYDIDLSLYKKVDYETVLIKKITAGKKLLKKLVLEDQMANSKRINDVVKATEFNEKLLMELGYSLADVVKMIKEKNV